MVKSNVKKRIMKKKNYLKRKRIYRKRDKTRAFYPFPQKKRVVLKYSGKFTMDPSGVLATATQVMRANSIYDPNTNLTGTSNTQPYGMDQYEAIYTRYRVLKSKIVVRFMSSSGNSSSGPSEVGIYLGNGEMITDFDLIREVRGSKWNLLPLDKVVTLTNGYNAYKQYEKHIAETTTLLSQNPNDQTYFTCFCRCANDTVDGSIVYAYIDIYYTVEFSDLKNLGKSS